MESVFETRDSPRIGINYIDVLEQFSKLNFYDSSDAKCINSKCLNKITEINLQKKSYSEKVVPAENKKIEDNESSFILKNKESVRSIDEGEDKTGFCNHPTDNCEINSKKCSAKNTSFVGTLENINNELTSLSLSSKYNDGNSFVGNESDSDNDEQVESATLRERYPTRHNRPGYNNHRPTPFLQNHRNVSQPHSIPNNFQTFPNVAPHIPNDFNTLNTHYANTSMCLTGYSPNPINSSRIFHSGFPSSELVTDEAWENMFSCPSVPFDSVIPYTSTTNQISDDFNPHAVSDVFDSLVPSPSNDIRNLSVEFSEEINSFSHLNEQGYFEPNETGCAVIDEGIETSFDSFIKHLTEEETNVFLKILSDSSSDYFSSQNQSHLNLDEESPLHIPSSTDMEKELNDSSIFNQNTNSTSIFEEFNCQTNHIFHPKPDNRHSNPVVEPISVCSHFNEINDTFGKFEQFCNNSPNLMNEPENYSNLVNIDKSFNTESLSTCTSNHNNVSKKIETSGKRAIQGNKWGDKGQNNAPVLSQPETVANWDVPFGGVDDNSFPECVNIPENRRSYEKKHSKSAKKPKEIEIDWKLGTAALNRLLNSPSFRYQVFEDENKKIIEQNLREREKLGVEAKKVIYIKKSRAERYRGTNLHRAIREAKESKKIEKVVSLVECHKMLHDEINTSINIVDSDYKTVLDYSKEYGMDLLTAYLVENLAEEWVKV